MAVVKFPGKGLTIDGGSFGAGRLYKDAGNGLVVAGITGSTYDFDLATPAGADIMRVPTGTALVEFVGGVKIVGGGFGAGRIYKDAGLGLVIAGITGSTTDLDIATPAGVDIMSVPTGTANVVFGGSLKTVAPTGGAGAWKLGIANAVSPTAPNRTIAVDIGGTVYYIAAKTTND